MGEEKDLLSTLLLELRRGTLTISVLSQMNKPKYGYALVQSLEEKGVAIDPNTLLSAASASGESAAFRKQVGNQRNKAEKVLSTNRVWNTGL